MNSGGQDPRNLKDFNKNYSLGSTGTTKNFFRQSQEEILGTDPSSRNSAIAQTQSFKQQSMASRNEFLQSRNIRWSLILKLDPNNVELLMKNLDLLLGIQITESDLMNLPEHFFLHLFKLYQSLCNYLFYQNQYQEREIKEKLIEQNNKLVEKMKKQKKLIEKLKAENEELRKINLNDQSMNSNEDYGNSNNRRYEGRSGRKVYHCKFCYKKKFESEYYLQQHYKRRHLMDYELEEDEKNRQDLELEQKIEEIKNYFNTRLLGYQYSNGLSDLLDGLKNIKNASKTAQFPSRTKTVNNRIERNYFLGDRDRRNSSANSERYLTTGSFGKRRSTRFLEYNKQVDRSSDKLKKAERRFSVRDLQIAYGKKILDNLGKEKAKEQSDLSNISETDKDKILSTPEKQINNKKFTEINNIKKITNIEITNEVDKKTNVLRGKGKPTSSEEEKTNLEQFKYRGGVVGDQFENNLNINVGNDSLNDFHRRFMQRDIEILKNLVSSNYYNLAPKEHNAKVIRNVQSEIKQRINQQLDMDSFTNFHGTVNLKDLNLYSKEQLLDYANKRFEKFGNDTEKNNCFGYYSSNINKIINFTEILRDENNKINIMSEVGSMDS